MEEKPYFSSSFKRINTNNGSPCYVFNTCYTQDDTNHNEKIPLSINGSIFYKETEQISLSNTSEETNNNYSMFSVLPKETCNPDIHKKVYEQWILDCGKAFIKPPTLEQCLANTTCVWDSNAPFATMNPSEEDSDWILQWIPTKVSVCMPNFQIYWAASYKIQFTRIPDVISSEKLNDERIELQNPEKTYTVIQRLEPISKDDLLQEFTDINLPYSDIPDLRFDSTLENQQREKYRRRIRDARIRAKLARYRAERLAQRYEKMYGVYPEEDEDECQTEAEQTEDE